MKTMAPPAAIRWCAVLLTLILSLFFSPSIAIYCDEDDCYDLLAVSQNANASEIKKAYYKLSLKHHPDKNPDPESRKVFVKIANAYEILKDEATREQYDYAIAHPEEVFYNTARYYRAYYGHKTDPRAVMVGVLLILSAFQYLNRWTRYNQAVDMVKKTPAYKNRLRALELERSGGTTNKKKSNKQMDKKREEDLSKELELDIKGSQKPSIWELIAVRFILLPYTIGKLLLWYGCWSWRYKVKRAPYSWEDAAYLTRNSLRVPLDAWLNIGGTLRGIRWIIPSESRLAGNNFFVDAEKRLRTHESTKEDLIQRRLWIKSNLESYLTEMRKEYKRRR